MVSVDPPEGWRSAILAERAQRDEEFRLAPDTPIPPADLASFDGLEYWDPDPSLRFVGPIHRYPEEQPFEVITTTGKVRPCVRHGWVSFRIDGARHNLQIYRLLDAPETADPVASLFLPFTDATSGKESYPAGRYIELEIDAEGRYVLDFNRAHNPLCAYGMPERYACPVTPPENRLPVRVAAGERGYHKG